MSGFASGSLWGLVLGGVGLVFISQLNEQPAGNEPPLMPQLTAPETALAEATPEGLTDGSPDVAREFVEAAPRVAIPEAEVTAPETDTTPSAPPMVSEIETALTVPEDVSNPEISAGLEEPLITRTVTSSPTVPQPEEDVLIATQPAQPAPNAAAPDSTDVAGVAEDVAVVPEVNEPEIEVVETPVEEPELVAVEEVEPEPTTVEILQVTPPTEDQETPEVVAEAPVVPEPFAPQAPSINEEVSRPPTVTTDVAALPQVEAPSSEPEVDATEPEATAGIVLPQIESGVRVNRPGAEPSETAGVEAEVTPTQDVSEDAIALERYAATFERSTGLPLMSIVLLDDLDNSNAVQSIAALPFPTTVIIDALSSDATTRMRAYRDAGVEVAMQTVLPLGAVPADVEVAFEAAFDILPETVALFSGENGIIQSNRAVSEQVIEVLQSEGRGLVIVQRGFGSAIRQAQQMGLPAVLVERELDGAEESASAIGRALDQAAFRARQSGDTVLLARAVESTIAALSGWSLENDGAQIALAPVSAILRGDEQAE